MLRQEYEDKLARIAKCEHIITYICAKKFEPIKPTGNILDDIKTIEQRLIEIESILLETINTLQQCRT